MGAKHCFHNVVYILQQIERSFQIFSQPGVHWCLSAAPAKCYNITNPLMTIRKIIHIDMDAFFAAIEQRDNPALRGKAIAVGHDGPRGVVATASYEARQFGVHSALSARAAKQRCPGLIFIPARMEVYKEVSRQIRAIFQEYTELVEPLSIDEAFLDVTHLPCATQAAKEIKEKIFQTTGLTASAGVSINKMLAKIASDYQKPNGLFVITPKQAAPFAAKLPVEKFFGIGHVTAQKMHRLGIYTGADLRQKTEAELVRLFGKAGRAYFGYARGQDPREVQPSRQRLSCGAENTFDADTSDLNRLLEELKKAAHQAWVRTRRAGFLGKTVTLKLKYADFQQITRSQTFAAHLTSEDSFYQAGRQLLQKTDFKTKPVRLIGLTLSRPPAPPKDDRQLQFDF